MRKAFKNMKISAMTAGLLLALSLCRPAFAAGNIGISKESKGSISVTLTEQGEDEAVAGAELTLRRTGSIRDEGHNLTYVLDSAFKGSGLSLEDLQADGLADSLAGYALDKEIGGMVQKTGADGFVLFDSLEAGLYLVTQETPAPGHYPIAPFLVSVPMTSQDGSEWVYNVDARPKVERVSGGPVTHPPGKSDPPAMIQTGQFNWPVPALAIAGTILFAVGWTLTYLEGKKDDETLSEAGHKREKQHKNGEGTS